MSTSTNKALIRPIIKYAKWRPLAKVRCTLDSDKGRGTRVPFWWRFGLQPRVSLMPPLCAVLLSQHVPVLDSDSGMVQRFRSGGVLVRNAEKSLMRPLCTLLMLPRIPPLDSSSQGLRPGGFWSTTQRQPCTAIVIKQKPSYLSTPTTCDLTTEEISCP